LGEALWLGEDRGAKGLVQGQLAEGRGGADLELSRAPVHMTLRVRCTAGAGEVSPDGRRDINSKFKDYGILSSLKTTTVCESFRHHLSSSSLSTSHLI
jgi:hypothetical protein